MHFLNPTYLWAFLSLLVPIGIHLWNKKESITLQVGSIQFLKASKVKKSKRLQFNELLLLLLRLLVLSVLVLIIAEPQLTKENSSPTITYLIEPSLIQNEHVKTIIDSLPNTQEVRWLKEGFPKLLISENDKHLDITPNYWQLAQTMGVLETDSIVVFTKALVSGIKGRRPKTSKAIEWIVLPSKNKLEKTISAVQNDNELELISISSSNLVTTINKRQTSIKDSKLQWHSNKDSLVISNKIKQEKIAVNLGEQIKIQLYYSKSFENEKNYIEATFRALSKYTKKDLTVEVTNQKKDLKVEGFDLTVWLSTAKFPKEFNPILAYRPDDYAGKLVEESPLNGVFYITNPLNRGNVLSEHLAEQLLSLLERDRDILKNVEDLDQRQLALEELRTPALKKVMRKQKVSTFNLSVWLWPFLMLLLIVERIIAKWRSQ